MNLAHCHDTVRRCAMLVLLIVLLVAMVQISTQLYAGARD